MGAKRPPQSARGTLRLPARRPPRHQRGLPGAPALTRPGTHPPRCQSPITSEARVVVSGPDLSDFDRAPAQSRQNQTLAQEVAARVAEGVCLSRHVRALRKAWAPGCGYFRQARGRNPDGGGGDSGGGGDRGSLPRTRSPPRVHVVWNRKTEKPDTGSEGSGAEPVTASPPPRRAKGGPVPGHAAIGPRTVRASSRRASIGLPWSWAGPGPRRHWPSLERGGARAPATERRGARGGGGLDARAEELVRPHSLRGGLPQSRSKERGLLGFRAHHLPLLSLTAYRDVDGIV